VRLARQLLEDELADLGKGAMPDVMDQRGRPYALSFPRFQPEAICHPPGEVTGADAVFEPAVAGSGIDEVRQGELLDAS
jgi:hypothetical protein